MCVSTCENSIFTLDPSVTRVTHLFLPSDESVHLFNHSHRCRTINMCYPRCINICINTDKYHTDILAIIAYYMLFNITYYTKQAINRVYHCQDSYLFHRT